ncbi:MAG: class I SAM-dependent methyltransferase [Pseudomonadales bacterium]|jgi:predicted O-methyltransferase YrrM|nr:class I SAM-dependent methyltransferase [Pseudomonadales bacterium]MDP6470025.1 class I SAM-dependent methyltransferase [Pseudomonadales bacterium]MDP6826925.1 class I SAM-dependent methyltransferase [Pseudomonadales bacterium]|tara:strand:- start:157 stop:696 length:540 start_codon:yes stop_codon:yes gene_type:complete
MNVGDEKGPILEDLVTDIGPGARILELGSFVGYSAILMARHLHAPGHLTSVDVDADATRVSCDMADFAGLGDRTTFLNGTLESVTDQSTGPYDLVFLDRWKGIYQNDVECLLDAGLISATGIIVADNVGPRFGHNAYVPWILHRHDFISQFVEGHLKYSDIEDRLLISRRNANPVDHAP